MKSTGLHDQLGPGNFLDEDGAVCYLFHKVLDPAICIYECDVRVFLECQNLPKRTLPELHLHTDVPQDEIPVIAPRVLWEQLRSAEPPLVYDVREPREYQRAHIPQAQLLPLPQVIGDQLDLPSDQPVVLTCRSGRRSLRAASLLRSRGYANVSILEGGLLAWEASGLLEAVA